MNLVNIDLDPTHSALSYYNKAICYSQRNKPGDAENVIKEMKKSADLGYKDAIQYLSEKKIYTLDSK